MCRLVVLISGFINLSLVSVLNVEVLWWKLLIGYLLFINSMILCLIGGLKFISVDSVLLRVSFRLMSWVMGLLKMVCCVFGSDGKFVGLLRRWFLLSDGRLLCEVLMVILGCVKVLLIEGLV